MNITEKYIEALKSFDDWVIVSEWATRFGELHPDLLEKANKEAENQANETTGLREIAARISSAISRGAYENKIEIDSSERPRKIRFLTKELRTEYESHEIEEDIAPLKRDEIIRLAMQSMGSLEKYRGSEFEAIAKLLKSYFGLDFEVDHACALLSKDKPGVHHPDNFQLILKAHNAKKNNNNWDRFTIDEQVDYIESAIKMQKIVSSRFNIEIDLTVLDSLLERLKKVF